MDSGVRGSEKPEDNESGLKRLENLIIELAQKMKQDSSELKQELAQKTSESKQEISAVAAQMDLVREDLQATMGKPDSLSWNTARSCGRTCRRSPGRRLWQ